MIPFTLIFKSNEKEVRVPVAHYTVPKVGDKVIPPGEDTELTVLTVEHDLRTMCENNIWVVLS